MSDWNKRNFDVKNLKKYKEWDWLDNLLSYKFRRHTVIGMYYKKELTLDETEQALKNLRKVFLSFPMSFLTRLKWWGEDTEFIQRYRELSKHK
ncbi:hypothetical protein ACLGL1_07110 [Peptococcus simiae]|uniref:hypothetical protein n=1 Tax=Peptococcus simiae TaxID=1643805 RepID=UPI00397FF91C